MKKFKRKITRYTGHRRVIDVNVGKQVLVKLNFVVFSVRIKLVGIHLNTLVC